MKRKNSVIVARNSNKKRDNVTRHFFKQGDRKKCLCPVKRREFLKRKEDNAMV